MKDDRKKDRNTRLHTLALAIPAVADERRALADTRRTESRAARVRLFRSAALRHGLNLELWSDGDVESELARLAAAVDVVDYRNTPRANARALGPRQKIALFQAAAAFIDDDVRKP